MRILRDFCFWKKITFSNGKHNDELINGGMRNKLPAEVGLRKLIELDFAEWVPPSNTIVVICSTPDLNAFRTRFFILSSHFEILKNL